MTKREVMSESREDAYKLVITVALVFSLGSMLMLSLLVPAMYNYVQNVGSYSSVDLNFCDGATTDIELEMTQAKGYFKAKFNKTRSKRTVGYGGGGGFNGAAVAGTGAVSFAGNVGFQECPACCSPGARGPDGDPGIPGLDGAPGPDGAKGRPGTTPNATCIPERIFEPPPCLPCPQGPRGPPGHPGFPGEPGEPGIRGAPGRPGIAGERGARGQAGPGGPTGEPGPKGDPGLTPDAHVIPGPPGEPGDPGPWGLPGHQGSPGEDGYPGVPGEKGWPGPPGAPGGSGPSGPPGPIGEAGPPGTPGTCVCQETEVIVEDVQTGGGYGGYSSGGGYGGQGRAGYIRLAPGEADKQPGQGSLEVKMTETQEKHESNSGRIPEGVNVLPPEQVRAANTEQEEEEAFIIV